LLPEDELAHFEELRQWLLENDVATKRVYSEGSNVLLQSFVPAFRPFGQPIVALFKRKKSIMSPYMTLFLAFGNVSYQIFLPCPKQDMQLIGKELELVRYPHLYELQPWRAKGEVSCSHRDLSSPERTAAQDRKMGWSFQTRQKMEEPSRN
jgi:hypothetical protein